MQQQKEVKHSTNWANLRQPRHTGMSVIRFHSRENGSASPHVKLRDKLLAILANNQELDIVRNPQGQIPRGNVHFSLQNGNGFVALVTKPKQLSSISAVLSFFHLSSVNDNLQLGPRLGHLEKLCCPDAIALSSGGKWIGSLHAQGAHSTVNTYRLPNLITGNSNLEKPLTLRKCYSFQVPRLFATESDSVLLRFNKSGSHLAIGAKLLDSGRGELLIAGPFREDNHNSTLSSKFEFVLPGAPIDAIFLTEKGTDMIGVLLAIPVSPNPTKPRQQLPPPRFRLEAWVLNFDALTSFIANSECMAPVIDLSREALCSQALSNGVIEDRRVLATATPTPLAEFAPLYFENGDLHIHPSHEYKLRQIQNSFAPKVYSLFSSF